MAVQTSKCLCSGLSNVTVPSSNATEGSPRSYRMCAITAILHPTPQTPWIFEPDAKTAGNTAEVTVTVKQNADHSQQAN